MLTLMYFRAIYYLRRELRAKEAKEKAAADLAAGDPSSNPNADSYYHYFSCLRLFLRN